MTLNVVVALAVASLLSILGGLGYVLKVGQERDSDTRCVLVSLLERGDSNLRKLKDEGTITTAQLRRSLKISEDGRARLRADC